MTTDATPTPASPPPLPAEASPKSGKTAIDPLEFFTACIVTALMLHLVWVSLGGIYVVPWFSALFWPEGPVVAKVEKKETVEVEVIDQIQTAPPPVELPPPPPDAPPPPPPTPEAMQTPPEPVAPMLAVPAEMPETKPLPPPKLLAVAPTTRPTTNPPAATAPPAASIPGPKGTGRVVDRGLYQRMDAEYPYEARKRRISGTVVVEAVFTPDGRVVSVEIQKSSGHSILDKAAIAHGLQNFYSRSGQAERVAIPIEYRLVSQ